MNIFLKSAFLYNFFPVYQFLISLCNITNFRSKRSFWLCIQIIWEMLQDWEGQICIVFCWQSNQCPSAILNFFPSATGAVTVCLELNTSLLVQGVVIAEWLTRSWLFQLPSSRWEIESKGALAGVSVPLTSYLQTNCFKDPVPTLVHRGT